MDALPPAPPGFFGKVPARGDFLSRRIPSGLVPSWEDWLGVLTTAAREAAGPEWPEAWLTAPLWHFALGDALAPPHGAAGVLVASADRVGRLFPFTVLGACDPGQPVDDAALGRWMQAVEDLVLDALQDGFDPAALDAALAALGPPPPVTGPGEPPGVFPLLDGHPPDAAPEDEAADAVAAILDDQPDARTVQPPPRGDVDADLVSILGDGPGDGSGEAGGNAHPAAGSEPPSDRPGPAQSVWWCRGSDRVPPVRLRCDGLPTPATGAAMALGGAGMTPG